jgi:hypothetical protein
VFAKIIKLHLLQWAKGSVSTVEAWIQDLLLQQAFFCGRSSTKRHQCKMSTSEEKGISNIRFLPSAMGEL